MNLMNGWPCSARLGFASQSRFPTHATRAMRSVLIDLARERRAERDRGAAPHLALTVYLGERLAAHAELVRVHNARQVLARIDPRMAQVVERSHDDGLNNDEIAAALSVDLAYRRARLSPRPFVPARRAVGGLKGLAMDLQRDERALLLRHLDAAIERRHLRNQRRKASGCRCRGRTQRRGCSRRRESSCRAACG